MTYKNYIILLYNNISITESIIDTGVCKGIHDAIKTIIHSKKNTEFHDDPFYIMNLKAIERKYTEWVTKFPDIKPYYAIKCNPDTNIIQKLSDLGCNFDCASREEITTILNVTNNASRIIFANPCKPISHIEYAERQNVSLIVFDSVEELVKIATYYPSAKVILRLAVDDSKSLCQFNSKFGCREDLITDILRNIKALGINLIGFSFHVGSGCADAECYYSAIKSCRQAYNIARQDQFNFDISIIDIGGGFTGTGKLVSFDDIVDKVNKAKEEFFGDVKEKVNFIAEPGRFFTEESQTLVVNVTSKKIEKGVIKYYLNDGVYGSFNCIHFDHQNPKINQLNNMGNSSQKFNSTFFGPTCDSMDVIYKDIMYTELDVGDWLYVENFGSYTNAPGATFNGFKTTDIRYVNI